MTAQDSAYPLGRKIAVFGKGGKTTLSKALAARFGLQLIEQDEIRHQPNWEERPLEDHRKVLLERFEAATTGWVSDGNYSAIRDLVYERVDTVIVLALPWKVMLWRTLKRTLRRSFTREVLWNGNCESFRLSFLSRDSVVYDLYRRRRLYMNMAEMAEQGLPGHVRLIVVTSGRELDELYRRYDLVRA